MYDMQRYEFIKLFKSKYYIEILQYCSNNTA